MKDADLIHHIRQQLDAAAHALPPGVGEQLADARANAARAARARIRPTFSFAAFNLQQRWGLGLSVLSIVAMLAGLSVVRLASIDQELERIAEIDRKVISDRLPIQAYLDPGFVPPDADALIEETDAGALASLPQRASLAIRDFWTLESLFPGATGTTGPSWGRLTVSQREALAPLEAYWPDLDANRKRKWVKIADRLAQMNPEQQAIAQNRMQDWVALPATDRRQAREVYSGMHRSSGVAPRSALAPQSEKPLSQD
jgi:hypothetical protein